mgnify:CR=1 FL=1
MTSFKGIVEFVAVAETQGFTAAAHLLGVSTSHVSRRVADLESRLGTALVARTTRNVRLTVTGQTYYDRCRELLDGLDEANETIIDQQVDLSGTLRVSAAGEFAENHVAPVLIEFAKQYPNLNVDIDFNSQLVNFVAEGIDFAIRYGRLTDSGLIARKLVDRSLIAAASPEYLKQNGTPKHPRELDQHQCLVAVSELWQFESEEGPFKVKANARWRSNSGRTVINACRAGLGIAYLPKSSFGDTFNDGSLIPVLKPYGFKGATSWVVYANRRFLPARARMAIQFLLEHFSGWEE